MYRYLQSLNDACGETELFTIRHVLNEVLFGQIILVSVSPKREVAVANGSS